MSHFDLLLALVIAAAAVNGILAGASLDQSIKQLPVRKRIGLVAFSAYARAADLGPGVAWYAVIGIGAALFSLAAAVVSLVRATPTAQTLPLVLAGITSLVHSFATSQAAPTYLSQRTVPDDETALARIYVRFVRWQTVRAVFQPLTFALTLWALVAF
ncbi:MAG TPA: hypothetical protein VIG30_09140 [Ktedonobacterales bacterium]|jgi:hypothetical protein